MFYYYSISTILHIPILFLAQSAYSLCIVMDIEVCIIVENPNVQYILSRLEDLGCPDDVLHRAASRIEDYENSGFTFTNQEEHKSIIVINRPDSAEEFIDTYNHEKNHVEMHICKEFGIDPYSEKAAYLSGQLAKKLFKA